MFAMVYNCNLLIKGTESVFPDAASLKFDSQGWPDLSLATAAVAI